MPHLFNGTLASKCNFFARSVWIFPPFLILSHFSWPSIRVFAVINALVQQISSSFWILIKLLFFFLWVYPCLLNYQIVRPLHLVNLHAPILFPVFRLTQIVRKTVIISQFRWEDVQQWYLFTWQMVGILKIRASDTELTCE